jgi:hypothetical protein
VLEDSSIPRSIDLVAVDTVGFRSDVSSDTGPGSRASVDNLAGSRGQSKTGGLSALSEETVTGSG